MFSLDIQKNLKKSFRKEQLSQNVQALLVPLTYLGVPTMLKLDGWKGLWAGVLSTVAVGAMFDMSGMIGGGVAAGAVHVAYSYGKDDIQNMLGRPPWNFAAAGMNGLRGYYDPTLSGLAAGPSQMMLPDGNVVTAYSPSDLPGTSSSGMSGYYMPQNPALSGHYETGGAGMADDDNPFFSIM